ncbi:MAG: cytochrome c oxidase subunit II [Planctomycetota bacterium]|nr:cytochrome c oxidase subunit II [Planctomycetota bacterium]
MNTCALTLAQQTSWLTKKIFGAPGASELARDSDSIFMWIFYFSLFWFILLMGLMIYWVIKYRRRPGVPIQRTPHHNTNLELAWTILPSLFLGYMFYIGFQGYIKQVIAPTNAEMIDVRGSKWMWTITYANGVNPPEMTEIGGNPQAPIIYIPVGRPVQFRMTSSDVLHSFWIPDFRFKQDLMPNRYSSFWIEAEAPGDHYLFCAEYCGDKHSEMSAIIRAIPADEYDALLQKWFDDSGNLTPVEAGKRLVESKGGCIACHSLTGAPGIGPTWLNAWGYEVPLTDGTTIPADDPDAWDNYIRESIINPAAKIRSGFAPVMTPFAGVFSEEELDSIVEYIKSLSDKAPAGEIPADDSPEQPES